MTKPALVFIHGWGFNASFWDGLAEQLSAFPQIRLDLGFFSADASRCQVPDNAVLVGHSLGFMRGVQSHKNWKAWIAINGFPRFVTTSSALGCVPAAVLRDMRKRLEADTLATLNGFYRMLGTSAFAATPNRENLRAALDELRDGDIGGILPSLDVPGLALAGGCDPLVPLARSEELGAMPNAMLKVRPEAGHLLPQSDPAWCTEAIMDFVGKL